MLANPGIAGVLSLFALCLWMHFRPRTEIAPRLFLLTIAVLLFGPLSEWVMEAESQGTPLKFDYFLYLIDRGLGLSAFVVARLFNDWQRTALYCVYQSLVFVMFAQYWLHLYVDRSRAARLLTSYGITFFTGPIVYLIVPGRGPRHAFGAMFPFGTPDVQPALVQLSGWPNAIPSLHVSTALLFVMLVANRKWLRAFAWLYLVGTVGATLAFEHYVIDLVVAVPFACFATLAAKGQLRWAAANFGMVLGWLVAIRFFTPYLLISPFLLKLLACGTIVAAVWTLLRKAPSESTVRGTFTRMWTARPAVSAQP
ncbi:MAG: phosphatase PAP2 family protein [Bryobacteraceae bacterium]